MAAKRKTVSGSQNRRVTQRAIQQLPEFWTWLDEQAARAGVSRNQYVHDACVEKAEREQ